MKKILSFILLGLMCSIGNLWAYYTPEADEVIILNNVYSASATDAGYSTHAAVAWGGTASTNSKKAGDPNNNGEATSSNVNGYSVKGNGKGKNITISVTGVSKIIVYHEKHSSRYVELRDGSKDGSLIGNGVANTYFTEVDLTGTSEYSIFLHGTTGTDDQDFIVYAVKLIKYGASKTPSDLTLTSSNSLLMAKNATSNITCTTSSTGAVTYSSDDENVATVSNTGVITAQGGGMTNVKVSQASDETYASGNQTVTVYVPFDAASGPAFTINNTTFSFNYNTGSLYFTNGVIMSSNNYNYGYSGEYIKCTANAEYTITIPNGVAIKSAVVTARNNYGNDKAAANWGTIFGNDYSSETLPWSDEDPAQKVFNFATDQTGTLSFTFGGNQTQASIVLFTTPLYTVTYNANGGTGSMESTTNEIVACEFVAQEGKMFVGWNTVANGSGTSYAIGDPVNSDLTLYAQWATLSGELIKAVHTGATTATVTGVIGGTIDKKTASDGKFGGKGQYFGLTLASGTFHTGDTLNVHLTTAGEQGSIVVYAEKEGSTSLYDTESLGVVGDNKFILPAAINDLSTIYICRTESNTWNGYVDFISVIRPVEVESETFEDLKINNGPTSYNRTGTVIDVIDAYLNPNVVVIKHVVYADGTEKNVNVEVEDLAVQNNQYVGHVTIAGEVYTINIAKLTSYDVTYMDGELVLGTEVVAANGHPAEYATAQNAVKLATFDGWYRDAGLSNQVANIAAEIISANATYYAKYTKRYATSINIEQYALDNGKSGTNTNALISQMGTQNYASNFSYKSGDNEIDVLNDEKGDRNYSYLGLKVKTAGTMFDFRLAQGNTVKVKFGARAGEAPQVSINGAAYANMTITDNVYTHTATSDEYISIKTADAKAVVFKQIAIGEDLENIILPSSDTKVTLSMNGWASYAANFAYDVSGATVYKAAYNGSDAVVLTEVVDAVVPANQGIILKGEEGATVTITPSDETASDFSGNGLVGVVDPLAASAGMYVLSTNAGVTEFNPCQAGVMIPAHKAYISISSNAPAVRIIFAENGATGINELEGAEKAVKFIENGKLYIQKDGVVYDATGAKVK